MGYSQFSEGAKDRAINIVLALSIVLFVMGFRSQPESQGINVNEPPQTPHTTGQLQPLSAKTPPSFETAKALPKPVAVQAKQDTTPEDTAAATSTQAERRETPKPAAQKRKTTSAKEQNQRSRKKVAPRLRLKPAVRTVSSLLRL